MEERPSLQQLQASADRASALLKAMGHPQRLLILCILLGQPRAGAGELARAVGLTPSATSQHLAKMRAEGLIASEREGTHVRYRIHNPAIAQIIATLKTHYCP
ncbi:helix-turn-helix transcriptional regulator [Edwardsiella piscicida]|uniref:ArsR/SmtB family transcription factor n=1 Tax=Edwardsiella piscicida TaxID=1263550 RepID=UPI0002C152FC|nr:metalloregulator ArsR/SmtB family transcription factor [Edwardsiella piscicida]AGH74534.1 putative transcriptional regulator [Edwardsiella piscicida C07-087]AOP43765.1 metalloregulator ArsR/SmtB family transcription factor [Edwardsiella piscicida]EKS7766548.1 helix-turn-helix transcriptional regulator [Edwardsiella piscicida]EKS7779693.1 helix-turn-helix transcriptional regulator [Edwardsiella piscicida]EKS7783114.1 helix-turn-helix transcriptional regulator [Edwardsiella piscicida]